MTVATQRTVLIVSPHFPPSSLAGVHRARHLANHLPDHGWRPIVVRADERSYAEPGDPALARLVDPACEQVRVRALPMSWTRPLGFGDIGLRIFPFLGAALDQAIAQYRPEAVLFTGFPFYPMLLAGRVKQRRRLPVILDFQDPWVSDFGAQQAGASKAGLAHRLAVALEPRALRHADFVTSVSEVQNQAMASRYPWLDASRMAAIPIGGDPQDFAALRGYAPVSPAVSLDPSLININYVGAFLPRAEPLARQLFRALAMLRASEPALAQRLRLNFIGGSNRPDGFDDTRVRRLAEAEGVADLVREMPQRTPFLEALSLLTNAHGLLLIGSDEPHYTASKIYPALMSGRPYLSLFHAQSSAHAILSAAGGGVSLAFEDQAGLDALTSTLADGLRRLAQHPADLGAADPAAYAAFTAKAVAGRFAAIFETVAQ